MGTCSSCGADLVTTNYDSYACSASGMPQGKCDREPVADESVEEVATDGATDDSGA